MSKTRLIGKTDKLIKDLYLSEVSEKFIAAKLSLSLKQVYTSLIRQKVNRRRPQEQNRIHFLNKPLSYLYFKPKTEKFKLLEIAALMLYKGEGAKNGCTVDFVNSDEQALKIFINYLRKICRVNEKRIKFYLYCFSDQDPVLLTKFWSKTLMVNPQAFTKPYVRNLNNTKARRTMNNGVLHIRYSDKKLLNHILTLIDQIAKKMIK